MATPDENKDQPAEIGKIDELSDTLYSRTRYKDPLDQRASVSPLETADVAPAWQSPKLEEILSHEREAPTVTPFMKKFFIFAALFFAATLFVAGFVFFGGSNFISSKNFDISVTGPTTAPAGEVLELEVTVRNGNNADLELADFSVQYPAGSRDPADTSKQLTFNKESLGVIRAGDESVRNIRMFLVGSTGETKEIKFSVEYKVKGSDATFYKEKTYQVTIGSSPFSLSLLMPHAVTSGENFSIVATVTLNSTTLLKNVMLRAEYPYGYSPTTATPAAFSENNVWALGDMVPGSSKKVEIKGKLLGENRDERTFRFYAGVADSDALSPNFKTVIVSDQETVAVERPSLGLNVAFNGDSSATYVAPAGQSISTSVRFQNNLPVKLINPKLEIKMSGSALDESSVSPNGGFYDSITDRIVWDIVNDDGLKELIPGANQTVRFVFSSLPELPAGPRDITLQLILSGTPAGNREPVSVTETRTVKIASQVSLSARGLYSIGAFDNTGPIPPKAEKSTTYTVVLSVRNTQNDVSDAKVAAKLGPAVTMAGGTSAGAETISYDDKTNTVTWNIGSLPSGTGFSTGAREASFQVTLTPSLSQVGTAPSLVTNIAFNGLDTETGKSLSVTAPTITTKLSSDPAFIQGDDIVVK